MNIQTLDSWLREHLTTKASAKQIAQALSLTSVSVEKLEPFGKGDFVYDIEVTTNRPDLMSVVGLAQEAAAVLPQFGTPATFIPLKTPPPKEKIKDEPKLTIKNDPVLVQRICAVILDVEMKDSPQQIKDRLETAGIRSLNNIVDVTNYVMRETGHPVHVFDYDRLNNHTLIIRAAKKGEKVTTLDKKEHTLSGGDIVADNGEGEIIDLLGVMGTLNSVVTNNTKRIVLFIDNNDPNRIRKTSMGLGIRTEAAVLNEKGIDRELTMQALLRGIELYKELANGKVISNIIDLYEEKEKTKKIIVYKEKINSVVGITIPEKNITDILTNLGFEVVNKKDTFEVTVPTNRNRDMDIQEDVIEEIARVYGYHKLPSVLPPIENVATTHFGNDELYFEKRAKEALKYWGFTETYTYSFVSQDLYEGPLEDAVTLKNPLTTDFVYMRKTLTPSLLQVVRENKNRDTLKIFEIANIYEKRKGDLPNEVLTLAIVIKKENASFYEAKGIIEQLATDLGINTLKFKPTTHSSTGADVYIASTFIGTIELLDNDLITVELNFEKLITHATRSKIFTPLPKYPPVLEDLSLIVDVDVSTGDIIDEIKKQSALVKEVTLLDEYKDTKTFHIVYQDKEKNLTTQEVGEIREKIIEVLKKKFQAEVK